MAKFSVLRDEEEDDHLSAGAPSSKRRRTSPPTSSPNPIYDEEEELAPEEERESSDAADEHDSSDSSVAGSSGTGSVNLILTDPDVLDCSICFESLTIPVFQCDNGHIACSSCCEKLRNKCPSCSWEIGHNRCRAIEKVLESVKISCSYESYGCREMISYCKKSEHVETCLYAPCSCPFQECIFRGSIRRLSRHMGNEHSNALIRFRYNSIFSAYLGTYDRFLIFQEEKDGVLFILSNIDAVTVKCLEPNPMKARFPYDVIMHKGCNTLKFQSFTESTTGELSHLNPSNYIMIPSYFYHCAGRLRLELCIRERDASCASISNGNDDVQSDY